MKLMILESGTKAKTVKKYLGKGWIVEACNGHVQDLPTRKSGKQGSKAMWASDGTNLPDPPWEWTDRAENIISGIIRKANGKGVEEVYIATDPDREGEFIAWRLSIIFSDFPIVRRVTFNEITESAIQEAMANHSDVDSNLVDAAKVRRFMDRLVGYRCSKFARSWNLRSMGRVQTPTLGFIVERELEREAHVPIPYHSIRATSDGFNFKVRFHEKDEDGAWFDDDGKHFPDRTFDGELAEATHEAISKAGKLAISSIKEGKKKRKAPAPFTTDTLLQAASSSLGWSMGKTSKIASDLYQAGHITYIRTDSTRTSETSRNEVKSFIKEKYGEEFLGPGSLGPDAKKDSSNVQDAHEAIRPTNPASEEVSGMEADHKRLYRLVWSRFTSSQMSDSIRERRDLRATIEGSGLLMTGTASWLVHSGWEEASAEFLAQPRKSQPNFDLSEGSEWPLDKGEDNPLLTSDETKPPRRFSESSIVKQMKNAGIGRPSTYVSIVQRIQDRGYVENENSSLVPTENGRTLWMDVAPIYGSKAGGMDILSASFTSKMEDSLDGIELGEIDAVSIWSSFSEDFKDAHNKAIEYRRRSPTPKQKSFIESRIVGLEEDVVKSLLDGREIDDLSGEEASDLIGSLNELSKTNGGPPASEKQISYLMSLIEKSGMALADALSLVGVEDVDGLTGGREGSASELIGMMRDANSSLPATEPQMELIRNMSEQLGISMPDVVAIADVATEDEITKSDASTLIKKLKSMRRKQGKGNRK
ncbi:MAG: DNA topoisomerase 1 [Euryarchaeota archaeon]|jgi:DNA topoisomerase-1|nr:DNA topoisomerase 1 [Euryarchaeota archaeon]|tara:strand:+ start:6519 stop:8798 length:2280 start_codon:yes stop_codon:yes gene_type:complete